MPREMVITTARRVYRSYGFVPIDTPVLEYLEILTGKGSEETDRQMYSFEDNGGRKVGMRFDLTVPLARFVAQHINDLGTPFKRYHIGKVWRGEAPQAGRYREFMQCDFDTIGTTSIVSDIETALIIHDLIRAIGFEKFTIQLNNRKVLTGLLEKLELQSYSTEVLRALDKIAKIGSQKVSEEMMSTTDANQQQVDAILKFASIDGNNHEILTEAEKQLGGNETASEGLHQLRQIVDAANSAGITESNLKVSISVARGLDYYTGTVLETFLGDLPEIGSVCSGGRYDNLASVYTKQLLPGIGASLGLDRLLAAMDQLGMLPQTKTGADLLIVLFDRDRLNEYVAIANALRANGIGVEIYPDAKKMGQQFKYADRKGFAATLVAGSNEFEKGVVQIKWLESGEQLEVPHSEDCNEIVDYLKTRLGR